MQWSLLQQVFAPWQPLPVPHLQVVPTHEFPFVHAGMHVGAGGGEAVPLQLTVFP
jgi:hypothetical protein